MLHENYYALLIRVNHYSDERLPDLKFAEKDCHDLSSVLTNDKISFFPEKNVKVLTGNQATTEKIKEHLYELRYRQPGDLIVIFFSGHGFFAGDEDNAYIGSYDVNIDDFGVGHSSISRLANLNLSHIKLDTEIASQDHSLITMGYVRRLVDARISSHSKVIQEGLEKFKQLKQIYKLKIDLIQGYAVREARPDAAPIEDNLRKEIAACLD